MCCMCEHRDVSMCKAYIVYVRKILVAISFFCFLESSLSVWAMALGEEVFIKTEEFFPECLGKRIFYFFKKKYFLPRVLHSGKSFFKKK
jgi:hypothetical protein